MSMAVNLDLDPHYKVKGYAGSMQIGHLADAARLATQTIRFYEREGLLPTPAREANGYRVYDDTPLNGLRSDGAGSGPDPRRDSKHRRSP